MYSKIATVFACVSFLGFAVPAIAQSSGGSAISVECHQEGNEQVCITTTCFGLGKDEVCTTTVDRQKMSVQPASGCFPNGPVISCADEVAVFDPEPSEPPSTTGGSGTRNS